METQSILVMNWRDIRNPEAGGAEVFTQEVAKRWTAWGHDVSVFASDFEGSKKEEMVEGVRIVRDGDRYTVYGRAKRAYRERFRHGTDVVIDEINTRPFFTPRYVDGGTAVFALIYQLAREYWFYETPFPLSIVGRFLLEDYWLREYREIPTVTISRSTHADLSRLGFRDVTVVPVGLSAIPLSDLPQKDQNPTFIYIGRLKKTKLPDHALQAFGLIKRYLSDARLWVVGDGQLRKELERKAPPGVVFYGRVTDSDKMGLMRRSHVLLSPSIREGWSLAVLEANAVGTVAVGYDVPGLRDSIVDGVTGKLVPFGDIEALALESSLLLRDVARREEFARQALTRCRGFDWDRTARMFLDVVQRPRQRAA